MADLSKAIENLGPKTGAFDGIDQRLFAPGQGTAIQAIGSAFDKLPPVEPLTYTMPVDGMFDPPVQHIVIEHVHVHVWGTDGEDDRTN